MSNPFYWAIEKMMYRMIDKMSREELLQTKAMIERKYPEFKDKEVKNEKECNND